MDSSKHLDWPEISGSQAKLSFYFQMSGILEIPKNKFFSNLEQEHTLLTFGSGTFRLRWHLTSNILIRDDVFGTVHL